MKDRKFKDDWPAPNEYLLELGRMTTIWGTLESAVNLAISKLAGYEVPLDWRALVMVAHSNFQQRVDIIGALCEQLAPSYANLRNYESVLAKIKAAQRARNRFAHNAIVTNEDTGEVFTSSATARGRLKTSVEGVTVAEIRDATAKIHEAMCALHSLVTGHELQPIWERRT